MAIGPAVFTGCISFQGDAVTALPEDKHSLSDPKGKPAPKINRLLTAKEIFNKSVDAEKRRKSKAEDGIIYDFQRKVVIDEVEGSKKKHKTRTYQSFSDHRDPVLLLIDGKKPTPEQAAKDKKEVHKQRLKIMGRGKSKDDLDGKEDTDVVVRNIEKHRDKFTPRLIGTETVNGRPAYVLQLLPKTTEKFKDAMVNAALKHMLIKFWIDQQEFQVSKAELSLVNPMYIIGGLAATVKTFEVTAYQKRLTEDIWADHRVTTHIEGRVLWTPRVINFSSESSGFKRLPAP